MDRSQSTAYGCVTIIQIILLLILACNHCSAQWVIPQSMISRDSKYVTEDPIKPGYVRIHINRTFTEAEWQNNSFFLHVEAYDEDQEDVLTYTIISGNKVYSTFKFGLANSPDTVGNLYVRNRNGIYKSDGTFRWDEYDLVIQVKDKGGLTARAHIYIQFIDPPSGVSWHISPYTVKKSLFNRIFSGKK